MHKRDMDVPSLTEAPSLAYINPPSSVTAAEKSIAPRLLAVRIVEGPESAIEPNVYRWVLDSESLLARAKTVSKV